MIIFLYTLFVVFISIVFIIALAGILANNKENMPTIEGEATAAMCTTNLLEQSSEFSQSSYEDFVIEQDMVYTYDAFNL